MTGSYQADVSRKVIQIYVCGVCTGCTGCTRYYAGCLFWQITDSYQKSWINPNICLWGVYREYALLCRVSNFGKFR